MHQDSIAYLEALAIVNPETKLFIDRSLAETYTDFIEILYQDLAVVLNKLQDRKQLYCNALEDAITMYIVDLLEQRQYQVTHDTKVGGHVDIVVRGMRKAEFLWLGEAKRDAGPSWITDGFHQLSRRYSTGGHFSGHGGILVYCQGKKAAQIFANWRAHLATLTQYDNLVIEDCPRNLGMAFVSKHTHDTSGMPYEVRHVAVGLFHAPIV